MNDEILLTTLKAKVKEEQKITAEVIRLLADVNGRKLYAKRGFDSLYSFCRQELNYCKGSAWRRCNAVFLMKVDSTVADRVESGELNITNAAAVSAVLKQAEAKGINVPAKELLEAAYDSSVRKAEEKIEAFAVKHGVKESPKDDLTKKLDRICALLSHKHPGLTHEDLIHLMADEVLEKLDPREKPADPKAGEEQHREKRYMHPKLRAHIWQRDQSRCTYVDAQTGRRCEATHFLEIDHIVPFARGGLTQENNLRLLCRTHNQLRNSQIPPPRGGTRTRPLFH